MPEPTALLAFWKNYDRKLYLRAAQLADELGYHSFWLPEAWGYEIFTLLTEMAVHTKRIQLGTGIVNVFSRTPGLLAMSAATVDEISEGRLILGIGTSGKNVIEGFHGRPFEKPLSQVRDVIKRHARAPRRAEAERRGRDARAVPPVQAGDEAAASEHPHLRGGAQAEGDRADRRVRRRMDPDVLALREARGRQGVDRRGRRARGARRVEDRHRAVHDRAAARRSGGTTMARQIIAFYIGGMGDYYTELLTRFGFGDDCKRIVDSYQDKSTRAQAADAVSDAMIEALTITGDPAHCIEELRRRRSFGMELPILNLPTNVPWEMVEAFIRGMAPSQASG